VKLKNGNRRSVKRQNSKMAAAQDSDIPSADTTDASSDDTSNPSISSDDDNVAMDDLSMTDQIIDRSGEPDALSKAMDLKERGNIELTKGHLLQAIQLYSEGIEYAPTNAILLSNRAHAYTQVENYGLALNDADRAIELDPTYVKGYYRRASANYALNHFQLARKDFRTVVKLKPKDRDARAKLQACDKAVREEAFALAIQAEQTAPLSSTYDASKMDIPSDYDGPHPSPDGLLLSDMDAELGFFEPGKLPLSFVMAAVERFLDQKLIHKRYVARLLISCRNYFNNLSSLMEIAIPTEPPEHAPDQLPRLTVCGDTHGQYYDVMHIFAMNGYPSRTNPYLFNGDFVDRGSFSVEVILTYLLFKLYDPDCIFLTRGNHETKNMNKIYGFEGEVMAKYDQQMFQLFLECFEWLPLAAVVGGKIFVTHGGLPVDPDVTLDDVRKVKRGMEPAEKGLMSDLLWSDPQPFPGKSPSKRGVGFAFGPDITHAFLKRNNLNLLVRSHEVKEEGYLVEHGGKTITVFSAPNYCDTMGNKGAFIHFTKTLEPNFTQFESVPHPAVKPMAYAAGMGGLFR
jgi:serine/threonine-protein phosphatase 5